MGSTLAPELLQLGQGHWNAETGHLSWQIPLDDDQLLAVVPKLALALDAQLGQHQWGADRHQWQLRFEGTELLLQFESLCDSLWIQAQSPADADVVAYLAQLWKGYDCGQ